MPVYHKFVHKYFGSGFETNDAILDTTPGYKPEIIFIGTFNPETGDQADFFYGRNFFWTAFKNLFINNRVLLEGRRMPQRGAPPLIKNPSLEEILKICVSLKLTFADLIKAVLHNQNPTYQVFPDNQVIYRGEQYNLIQDDKTSKKDVKLLGLRQLEQHRQIDWNTQNIINYLVKNPQIKTIYFTRKPDNIWEQEWSKLKSNPHLAGRKFANIYTPSGRRLPTPVMNNLLHRWVYNDNIDFGHLENNWLIASGVTLANFL
ncbi:MAG TPA: hypothetical protein VG367_07305 [Mucilaginibacter sp.]|jgi:hypothetical protein|nr:hypothetical protein [Mucilaginibacter sp.]